MSTIAKKRVCIVSQSHLCRNPRVVKEAITLCKAGYQVHILTAVYSDRLLNEDRELISGYPITYSFYSELQKADFSTHYSRLTRRAFVFIQEKLGIESRNSLGYAAGRLKKLCRNINAGLYIMHQELPTVIGSELLQEGFNIAFDLEDWYSEDLLPEAQAKRPTALLKKAEETALKKGAYCTTTSNALSAQLAKVYKSETPVVVYNTFPVDNNIIEKKTFDQPLKLFWFSQTIGPGRGIEAFIQLLARIAEPLELHLLGNVNDGYRNELISSMPQQHQLTFHPMVSNEELPAKIAGFDVGLALEQTSPPSRNYTITNKFFQYIGSGLPVIASETKGQREMFGQFEPGILLPQQPSETDIGKLTAWLADPAQLQQARRQAIAAAQFYNWPQEAQKITDLAAKAFENTR